MTNGHRTAWMLAGAAALAGCARGRRGADVIATCAASEVDGPAVARTAAEWRDLRPRLRGCVAPTSPVDFGRRMLVALPYRGAPGGPLVHGLVVDSVARRAGATVVYAARPGASTGCPAAAAGLQPTWRGVVVVALPAAPGAVRVAWARAAAWSECPGA